MTKVIAIANQKGGVGKTSTTVNLGAGLVRQGYAVLAIDFDPQANLTMALGFKSPDDMEYTVSNVLAKAMDEEPIDPAEGILTTIEGVDLIGEPRAESSVDDCSYQTVVDLFFNIVIDGLDGSSGERKLYQAALNMRYVLDLAGRRCSAPVMAVSDGTGSASRLPGILSANSYLLPVMRSRDYDDTAFRILELYYPAALKDIVAVNGYELANRMGLFTRKVRFRPGTDKRGIICFSEKTVPILGWDGEPKEINVRPLTILINADLCPTPEIENSTVVHECVHAYLDRRFFMLQSLAGGERDACTGRSVNGTRFFKPNSPIEWMELQAEKLPAYILMEENNTRRVIEDLYDDLRWDKSPENVMSVVEKLAERFGVSKSMAKYRMTELGFQEAEGVYCFADRKRIPDHGCENWTAGITYSISRPDAAKLLSGSREFSMALRSSCYTYIEGHYCLDDRKYIQRGLYGYRRLTEYARKHIDECCIAFRVTGRYASAEYLSNHAARKSVTNGEYQSRHVFESEPESKERVLQNKRFSSDAELWDRLKRNLPDDFGEAVKSVLLEKKLTWEELAARIGVTRSAVYKWRTGSVSLRHVVALCIALDVRADIGEELVRLAGLAFKSCAEHELLHAMLFETRDITIARANEIMAQNGIPQLTNGVSEELAG